MRKCFPTWASKYVVNMDNTGRIGKPQKSRKAKKIKSIDPFYKGDRKDSRIKHKDQRPISDDTQEFPQKVRRMMEAISHADQPGRKRRRQKGFRENDYVHPGMTKALDAVPQFKKKPGESEFRFMGRVERETQAVLQQSKLERKYKMKFERDEAGDLVPVKTGLSKQRKKRLKERKEKKKLQKQEKRRETDLEFGALKDEVKFGEVVTQPPTLTAKPRKGHALNQTKPGQRSLLLKSMMSGGGLDRAGQATATATSVTSRKPGETVKRKLLSPAQRVITDAQRQSAIDLYRQLKDKKVKPV